ncbi:transient-receptor-potential-like protein [Littorina saxatilis]|uniref:transient-receptor-potential-like protein n=1 Tax=Littorina saxatilis TaxID=31220 RepID=UPI0038B4B1C8
MVGNAINSASTKRGSYRGISSRNVTIPLETIKHGSKMDPMERVFLEAVEKGDKPSVMRCLAGPNPVSVNCTDMLGRSAIQIAVDNENTELVELLLNEDGVEIGDALLYAIREGVYKIVEMLIEHPSITREMLGAEWSKVRHQEESFDYSPDISPIILAAHCNQFEILQLLLLHGANIARPHQLSCSCKRCQAQVHADSLRHSLLRINTYRALASPAWISLTSPDPILTAFELSWELHKLALRENEFKDSYIQLSSQCKKYACDLLEQCRSSEEVIAVLNKVNANDMEEEEMDTDKLTLSRLKLAIKYDQKQFVAHSHCQQLLTSIWYEGLPGWRKRNGVMKFLICIGLIFILPFMAIYYLVFPRSKIGQLLRSPFMKFLYHTASFVMFLFLLICASTDIVAVMPQREKMRGPNPSQLEWLIVLWVSGFVWAECKQLWEEGLRAYVRQWWNWLDFIMLSLYLATFALRIVGFFQIESGVYGPRKMARKDWPTNDPTLISEGLFAIANVFSFARIIYLFQANQHLGPLQISLGCMLIDVAKFLFIFFLVLTSFACGLNQLYWYYKESSDQDVFFTLFASYITLFWAMFSLTPPSSIEIKDGQKFTQTVAELLFIAYHGMAIILLLNMLIAMMSNSFQDIENHADMEWKFSRSKLWMGYFDEGSTLPPPFNLIISPKSMYYLVKALERICRELLCRKNKNGNRRKSSEGTIRSRQTVGPSEINVFKTQESVQPFSFISDDFAPDRPTFTGDAIQTPHSHPFVDCLQYQEVMRRLICRYIHQTKKQLRQDGVNEDDLLEIKQDISSLRFELREDRKKETMRTTNHMDSLRRDIRQTLFKPSSTSHAVQRPPSFSNDHPAYPYQPGPGPDQGAAFESSPSHGLLSRSELDQLRKELVTELKDEIRTATRHMMAVCMYSGHNGVSGGGHSGRGVEGRAGHQGGTMPAPQAVPQLQSDLYHTHLYTQL